MTGRGTGMKKCVMIMITLLVVVTKNFEQTGGGADVNIN